VAHFDYDQTTSKWLISILANTAFNGSEETRVQDMSEEFCLSEEFVIRRLKQIKNRILLEELSHVNQDKKTTKLPPGHVQMVIERIVNQRKLREEREVLGYYAENYN
jgi:hypothetical protein